MSNLTLTAQWHDTINQVETSDPITGGADGNANLAPKQLAESLLWLKKQTIEPAQQLDKNGYTKLAGGLILQWGTVDNDGKTEGNIDVVFPIPFPTACLNVTASRVMANVTGDLYINGVNNPGETEQGAADGFALVVDFNKVRAIINLQTLFVPSLEYRKNLRGATWFAIGY